MEALLKREFQLRRRLAAWTVTLAATASRLRLVLLSLLRLFALGPLGFLLLLLLLPDSLFLLLLLCPGLLLLTALICSLLLRLLPGVVANCILVRLFAVGPPGGVAIVSCIALFGSPHLFA